MAQGLENAPPIPSPMTLSALQLYVREIVKLRGFTTNTNEIFILLVEEVGELASELSESYISPIWRMGSRSIFPNAGAGMKRGTTADSPRAGRANQWMLFFLRRCP